MPAVTETNREDARNLFSGSWLKRFVPLLSLVAVLLMLSACGGSGLGLNTPQRSQALTITTDALADGQVGQVYSEVLAAAGGTAPYLWVVTSGQLPDGLALSGDVISGTPVTASTSAAPVTIEVHDSADASATVSLSINILPAGLPGLQVATTALPGAQVGQPYSQALTATGGSAPYTWVIAVGTLPAGLAVSGDSIAGTPVAAGVFGFTIEVSDTGGTAASTVLSISVAPSSPTASSLRIMTTALADGQTGVVYSMALAAADGTAPYAWRLDASSGALPTGLFVVAAGSIEGTPMQAGAWPLVLCVTDNAAGSVLLSATLTILPASNTLPPTITTTSLAIGDIGAAYSSALEAEYGTTPYTWSLGPGSDPLPQGLTLDPAGSIDGAPAQGGVSQLKLRVTDAAGHVKLMNANLAVRDPANPLPLTVITARLAIGKTNQSYSQYLVATGGTAPYTWSLLVGPLPSKTEVADSYVRTTGTDKLSAQGAWQLILRVADATAATADLSVTFGVEGNPTITPTSMPRGEVGVLYSQPLNAFYGRYPYLWSTPDTLPAGLSLVGDRIVGVPAATGVSSFTIEVQDSANRHVNETMWLTIQPTGAGVWRPTNATGAPGRVHSHSMVWDDTHGRAIVWGGMSVVSGGTPVRSNSGAMYDPVAGQWTPVSTANAPTPREKHDALWTGATGNPATENRMIVWGGYGNGWSATSLDGFKTGGVYNPATDTWENKPNLNSGNCPLTPRVSSAVVWTGQVMFVWGGRHPDTTGAMKAPGASKRSTMYGDGAVYDLAADTWTLLPTAGDPSPARAAMACAWTGDSVIMFGGGRWCTNGGRCFDHTLKDCYLYQPGTPHTAAGVWLQVDTSSPEAPEQRYGGAWAIIGDEFLIWGGSRPGAPVAEGQNGQQINSGSAYNFVTGQWRRMAASSNTPHYRSWASPVSAPVVDGKMAIWGGSAAPEASLDGITSWATNFAPIPILANDGAVYDPVSDTWTNITVGGGPIGRKFFTAVSCGHEFMIWGGNDSTLSARDDGAVCDLR